MHEFCFIYVVASHLLAEGIGFVSPASPSSIDM